MNDTMGNLLTLTGDDNAAIKDYIESILRPDPESDGDKVIDFAKIISVTDENDETECLAKWGVIRGASNTQVYFEGEGNPPTLGNLIYFVRMILSKRLRRQYPNNVPIFAFVTSIATIRLRLQA